MTDFQNFIDFATKDAIAVFSAATLSYKGVSGIRCDIGEELQNLDIASGGKKREILKSIVVRKLAMPTGLSFSVGDTVTIAGVKLEIDSFNQDEISYTLTTVIPRQKRARLDTMPVTL